MADKTAHPVLKKAAELAEALKESPEFKDNNFGMQTVLLAECNMIISAKININYAAIVGAQSSGSCCG